MGNRSTEGLETVWTANAQNKAWKTGTVWQKDKTETKNVVHSYSIPPLGENINIWIKRGHKRERPRSLQIGPVIVKKRWRAVGVAMKKRWGFGFRGMLLCSTPPCTWAGWRRWRRCTRSWRRSRGRWRTGPGRRCPAWSPASNHSGGSPTPARKTKDTRESVLMRRVCRFSSATVNLMCNYLQSQIRSKKYLKLWQWSNRVYHCIFKAWNLVKVIPVYTPLWSLDQTQRVWGAIFATNHSPWSINNSIDGMVTNADHISRDRALHVVCFPWTTVFNLYWH